PIRGSDRHRLGAKKEGAASGPHHADVTARSIAAAVAAATPAAAVAATEVRTHPRLARPGLVDRQPTAPTFPVVQAIDGRLRVGRADHLHEAEAPAASRVTVRHHLGALDLTELGEQLLEVRTIHLERQVPYVQFLQGDSLLEARCQDPLIRS